ncbi:hypothetical protein TKK_0007833 [Trichogramma kaykai]
MKICKSDFAKLLERSTCESKFFHNEITNPLKECSIIITGNHNTSIFEYKQKGLNRIAFYSTPENDFVEIKCTDKSYRRIIKKVGTTYVPTNCEIVSPNVKKITTSEAPKLPRFDPQLDHLSLLTHRNDCAKYLTNKTDWIERLLRECERMEENEQIINVTLIFVGSVLVWAGTIIGICFTIKAIFKMRGAYDAEEETYQAAVRYYEEQSIIEYDYGYEGTPV